MGVDATSSVVGTSLRIGVTGHRLARLGRGNLDSIMASAAQVLADIGVFAAQHGAAQCSLVTNLADGADSLVADAALALGWPLDAVLPFARGDYADDFSVGVIRDALERHLTAAHRIFELPGTRGDRGAAGDSAGAYERAGRVVIAQADLLIGVWDGQPAQGRGGAAQIIAEAVDQGLPVIIIDPAGKRAPELLWDGLEETDLGNQGVESVTRGSLDRLGELIAFLLDHSGDEVGQRLLQSFERGETVRGSWIALAYPLLVRGLTFGGVMGGGGLGKPLIAPPNKDLPGTTLSPATQAIIRQPFARAELEAGAAARLFRSGYVCNFSLAALAVLLSMLGLALPEWMKPVLVAGEVVTIFSILAITRMGNRQNWHRRWLDNRHLAERLRCLEISVQLGDLDLRGDPSRHSGPSRHSDWASWYARGVARKAGLPNAVVSGAYLNTIKSALLQLISDQLVYLSIDAQRMHRVEHRLHRLGTMLFAATALACIGLLLIKLIEKLAGGATMAAIGHPLILAATIASAVLPAIGAAIYGIRMQGDFSATAGRDEELVRHLTGLHRMIAADPADFNVLQRRARRVTGLLTEDQASWLQAYHARPLTLPG